MPWPKYELWTSLIRSRGSDRNSLSMPRVRLHDVMHKYTGGTCKEQLLHLVSLIFCRLRLFDVNVVYSLDVM
jgi:hypothetical protein